MTEKEFQERYHNYSNPNGLEAAVEAMKIKITDSDDEVVAVKIGDTYALMLRRAAEYIKDSL